MPLADMFITELELEAKTTRRVLERVPDDKLASSPRLRKA